ncbi:hypothetical protein QYF36_000361 [Acer negundo]|nr:hypothetical protein QYF36_000361 [Acer negundo]
MIAKQGQVGVGDEKRGQVGEKNVSCVSVRGIVEKGAQKSWTKADKGKFNSDDSHWSSEEESGVHIFPNSHKVKEDCSKRSGVGRPKFGLSGGAPSKWDPIQLVSNNRAVEIKFGEASSIGREVQSGSVCSIDSVGNKDQMGNASIAAEKDASTVISQSVKPRQSTGEAQSFVAKHFFPCVLVLSHFRRQGSGGRL